MNFDTKYKREAAKPEKLSRESKVEKVGYVPPKMQIEAMVMAGQRLDAFRREMYDFGPDDEDDGRIDPTRNPNFDMADATQMLSSIKPIAAEAAEKEEKEVDKPQQKSDTDSETTS